MSQPVFRKEIPAGLASLLFVSLLLILVFLMSALNIAYANSHKAVSGVCQVVQFLLAISTEKKLTAAP